MRYGITYKGSKNRIAEDIINRLPSGERFVDLFGGGFAMSHCALLSGKYESVLYNDIEPLIVDLIRRAINGEFNYDRFTPKFISREEFFANKDKDGYIKYIWSFSNNGKDYIYGRKIEPIQKQMHNLIVFNKQSDLGITLKSKTIEERRLELMEWLRKYKKRLDLHNLEGLKRMQALGRLDRLLCLERLGGGKTIRIYKWVKWVKWVKFNNNKQVLQGL